MSPPVLIFGAHGGIGEALARALAARGTPLHLTARDPDSIADLAGEVGAEVSAVDAQRPESIDEAVAAAAAGGRGREGESGDALAGLAWCIGSIDLAPLGRTTDEAFLESYRLNVVAPARAVRAAAPALGRGRGAVVLFSSVAARQGFPQHAVIGAAKAGVEGLTVSLAAELAPNVRVNCIAPSLTRSALSAPLTGSDRRAERLAQMHPLQRLGAPGDSAAMAALLLGPEGGWITGQVIGIDGGRGGIGAVA